MSTQTLGDTLAVSYADIPAIDLEWLYRDVLPVKVPVIWAARGGTGKGMLSMAFIARVITGAAWPGEPEGTLHEPRSAVLVAPEDFANETIAYRLLAAIDVVDAPPERKAQAARYLFDLTELPDGTPFELPGHVGKLREAIEQINADASVPDVGLVVVDPLMACLEKPISTQLGARRVLYPLQHLARELNIAMVITHHMTKDGKTIMGATALTDAARLVFTIVRDENNDAFRIMRPYKANIADDSSTVRYQVVKAGAKSFALIGDPAAEAERAAGSTRVVVRHEPAEAPDKAEHAPGSAGSFKVLRRIINPDGSDAPGQDEAPLAAGLASLDDAKAAASADAGRVLAWQPASTHPGLHKAAYRDAQRRTVAYAVYPGK